MRDPSPRKIAAEANQISVLLTSVAAMSLFADPAFAACEGPDMGEAATVMTIPANQGVDVFHRHAAERPGVAEFCMRGRGTDWILMASHGAEHGEWSLLQSWAYPKTVEIKTTAVSSGDLSPLKSQPRTRTTYGYSFSFQADGLAGAVDEIVYCFKGGVGCPASRRVDFSD